MPQKKWYSLNMDKLYEIFKRDTGLTSCTQETAHQDVKKLDINNNNKNINNKESEQKVKYAEKVFLTENNFNSLAYEYGKDNVNKFIEELSSYKKSTGKVYEHDYTTLVRWIKIRLRENMTISIVLLTK